MACTSAGGIQAALGMGWGREVDDHSHTLAFHFVFIIQSTEVANKDSLPIQMDDAEGNFKGWYR